MPTDTPTPWSLEARHRRRISRYLFKCLKQMNLTERHIPPTTGLDKYKLKRLKEIRPQLRIMNPLGLWIQEEAIRQHKHREYMRMLPLHQGCWSHYDGIW